MAINPASGPPGVAASITASGFSTGVSVPPVTVTLTPQGGGTPYTATGAVQGSGLGRAINFTVPPGTPIAAYNVAVSGSNIGITNSLVFNVTPAPTFTLSPASAQQGDALAVTLIPSNTAFPSGSTASFGPGISVGGAPPGTAGPLVIQPNGSAIANLAIAPTATIGLRNVQVNGIDSITRNDGFAVTAAQTTPQIVSVTPSTGRQGQVLAVTILGSGTSFTSESVVSFGPNIQASSVVAQSATSLTVNLTIAPDAALGPRTVTVTTGSGEVSLPNGFSVLPASQRSEALTCSVNGGIL